MNISENSLINIIAVFYILSMIYLTYIKALKNNLEYSLSIFAIITSIGIIILKNYSFLMYIIHFLYCYVYLFSTTFLSTNLYFLGLNIFVIPIIIYSRYIYKGCVISFTHNKNKVISDFDNSLTEIIGAYWNWNYLFPMLLLVSCGRFIKLKSIGKKIETEINNQIGETI